MEVYKQDWRTKQIRLSRNYFIVDLISHTLYLFIFCFLLYSGIHKLTNSIQLTIISLVVSLVFFSILLLSGIISYLGTKYYLLAGTYKKRKGLIDIRPGKIIIEKGVFTKHKKYYTLSYFRTVTMHQTMLGRMLNYGNLSILNKESIKKNVKLKKVHNPKEVQKIILEMIDYATGDNFMNMISTN